MGLDLITMAATIGKLAANGQIGSGEPGKSYTFDGILEGKDYVPYMQGAGFVKVSADTPDLRNFEKIDTVNGVYTPESEGVSVEEGTAENGALFGAKGYFITDGIPFAVVITDVLNSPIPSTGLYFLCVVYNEEEPGMGCTELVMPSTIKTIDSKYLPSGGGGGGGGELPVIDLVALGEESVYSDSQDILYFDDISAEVRDKALSALTSRAPFVVRFRLDDVPQTAVFTPTYFEGDTELKYRATAVDLEPISSKTTFYHLLLLPEDYRMLFISRPLEM